MESRTLERTDSSRGGGPSPAPELVEPTAQFKARRGKTLDGQSASAKLCVAICFEGVCAVVNQPTFAFEVDREKARPRSQFRDKFVQALQAFKQATASNVQLLLYTYLPEAVFAAVNEELLYAVE